MHTYSQALFISVNFTHFINYKVYARLLVHNLLKYTVRVLWVVARVLLCGCKVVAFFRIKDFRISLGCCGWLPVCCYVFAKAFQTKDLEYCTAIFRSL